MRKYSEHKVKWIVTLGWFIPFMLMLFIGGLWWLAIFFILVVIVSQIAIDDINNEEGRGW